VGPVYSIKQKNKKTKVEIKIPYKPS